MYTISSKEWEKIKKIHQRCLDEKAELQEELDHIIPEITKLAIENKDLELEKTKLEQDLKETKMYLKLFMDKYYDILQNQSDVTADDLIKL
jgi:cell division septum initiation protein DivIVA